MTKSFLSSVTRFLGLRSRGQSITYTELMNLSDRQLEDIGLTRGLIETVVMQGPRSVGAVMPEGAIQTASANRNSSATVA